MIPAEPTARDATPRDQFPKLVILEDVDKGVTRIITERVLNNPRSKHWIATVKEGRERVALSIVQRSNAYDELVAALEKLIAWHDKRTRDGSSFPAGSLLGLGNDVDNVRALLARERATKGTTP